MTANNRSLPDRKTRGWREVTADDYAEPLRSRILSGEVDPPDELVREDEERKVVDCPRCEKGTVKHYPNQNPMWWEVQHLRCSWCGGTGRIYEDSQ